ncbi:MAG: hypothetical protein RIR79_1143 [Pseudomonadota bacterium]|jgi:outer membrane protein assembly factor BamD
MFRFKLSVVYPTIYPAILAACVLGAVGCSSTPVDRTVKMTPAQIYAEAKDEMDNKQWDKAVSLLEKIEARAVGTLLAQQAELDKAYALYKGQEPARALATIERFMKLHPVNPAIDYALYLKGLVSFNEDLGLFSGITRQDLSERDQKASKESFEAFKELMERFPDSRYTPDAKLRMNYIVASLARYEVHVARYYYRRGAYVAAINRAQQAIADYRTVPAIEDALFILYQSYNALGMNSLRDDTKRILEQNYPQSELLKNGLRTVEDPWWKIW